MWAVLTQLHEPIMLRVAGRGIVVPFFPNIHSKTCNMQLQKYFIQWNRKEEINVMYADEIWRPE